MPYSINVRKQLHERLKNTRATRESLCTFYRAVFMKRAITTFHLTFFRAYFAVCFFYMSEYSRKLPRDSKCNSIMFIRCNNSICCLSFSAYLSKLKYSIMRSYISKFIESATLNFFF